MESATLWCRMYEVSELLNGNHAKMVIARKGREMTLFIRSSYSYQGWSTFFVGAGTDAKKFLSQLNQEYLQDRFHADEKMFHRFWNEAWPHLLKLVQDDPMLELIDNQQDRHTDRATLQIIQDSIYTVDNSLRDLNRRGDFEEDMVDMLVACNQAINLIETVKVPTVPSDYFADETPVVNG